MTAKRTIVTGASGFLGSHIMRLGQPAEVVGVYGANRPPEDGYSYLQADLTLDTNVEKLFDSAPPTALIHAAAKSNLDWCERNPELAWQINADVPVKLARACREAQCKYIFVSSDMVFDGEKGFYSEGDNVNPISHYGKTKVAAENGVLSVNPMAIVARVALIFGLPVATGRGTSFLNWVLEKLDRNEPVPLYFDQFRTPVEVRELADSLLKLAASDFKGIIHVAGSERLDRYTFGEYVCKASGHHVELLKKTKLSEDQSVARRPKDLSLQTALLERILGNKLSDCQAALFGILSNP